MIRTDIDLAAMLKRGLRACTDEAYASDLVTTKMPGVVEHTVFDVTTPERRVFRVTVEPRIGLVGGPISERAPNE